MLIKKPFKKGSSSSVAPYYKAPSGVTFSLTFPSSSSHQEEASGGTTVNYTSIDIGAADTNRIVVVAVGSRMTTVNTITSVTIAGVSATLVSGTSVQQGVTNGSSGGIYQAAVPTGTTCTVTIVYGGAAARTGIAAYRLVTGTPTATSSDNKASASPIADGTLTIPSGGKGIAFLFEASGAAAPSWANATQDYAALAGGSSECSSASVTASSSAIGSGTVATSQIMVLAAWGS